MSKLLTLLLLKLPLSTSTNIKLMGGNVTAAHLIYQIMKTIKQLVLDYIDDLIVVRARRGKTTSNVNDAIELVADIKELQRIKENIEKGE